MLASFEKDLPASYRQRNIVFKCIKILNYARNAGFTMERVVTRFILKASTKSWDLSWQIYQMSNAKKC